MDLSAANTLEFEAGEKLFSLGSQPDSAFVVLAGRVCVEVADQSEAVIVGPGEILGEIDLLVGHPHSATAVALEPVAALPLSRQQLAAALRQIPRTATARAHDAISGIVNRITESLHFTETQAPEEAVEEAAEETAGPAGDTPSQANDIGWASILIAAETDELAKQTGTEHLTHRALPFTVGRKTGRREKAPRGNVDLLITDNKPYNLSRRHFTIDDGSEGPVLRDIGSLLGTEVNGERIGIGTRARHAVLKIGKNSVVAGTATSPFRFVVTVEPD